MTTKTKRRTKKYRNGMIWKNVKLTEQGGRNGGLFGDGNASAKGEEVQKSIAPITAFAAKVDEIADSTKSISQFMQAVRQLLAELEEFAGGKTEVTEVSHDPFSDIPKEEEDMLTSSDPFKNSKAFVESILPRESKPRYMSLLEYDRRQDQTFKQLS